MLYLTHKELTDDNWCLCYELKTMRIPGDRNASITAVFGVNPAVKIYPRTR